MSTVGLLSGVAVTDASRKTIILTGLVLIFVEAFSMGVGSFLSEHSAEEYVKRKELPLGAMVAPAIIMFVSYFFAGLVPLAPYLVAPMESAFGLSIFLSLVALFCLGAFGARMRGARLVRHGAQMLIIGGAAILIGVVVGMIVNNRLM